jgi:uncharacterized lipoprotein YehR (DUF1307 family)
MKIRQITALLIVTLMTMAVVSCGGGGAKASSPKEAFKSFYEAAKGKDVASLKQLMSKETIAQMEKDAKGQNKTLDQFLADESQKGLPPSMPELGEEKIEGETGTLKFKEEKASNWLTAHFVKEDGNWKIKFR